MWVVISEKSLVMNYCWGREVEFLAFPGDLDKQNDADWEKGLQFLVGFHLCHRPYV